MGIGSAVAIYFVIWWIALFVVLPFSRAPGEGADVPGADPGAPGRFLVGRALLLTSVIAAVVLAGFIAIRAAGIGLDDIPFLPAPG